MSYWQERQEKKYIAGEKKVEAYYKGLQKSFEQAKRECQKVMNDFYVRFGIENDINNMTNVKRALSKVEIGDLQAFIDLAKENMGKYNLTLNNMSIKARITRYEALQKQIDCILQQLYSIDYELKGKELITEVYKDSYYRTWFNFDQYAGFHAEYAQINPRTINELIAYPFNGADFSSRIWRQKDYLLQQLTESITTAIIQGTNPNELAKEFAKKFASREYEARRLLHTETSYMIEQAGQAAYQEDGIERYKWDATLDITTCEKCGNLDGKSFGVKEGIAGKTLPPAHAFCRCTTVPDIPGMEEFIDSRIARGADGKTYDVPGDMTYKEWHKKYVDGNANGLSSKIGDAYIPLHDEPVLLKSNVANISKELKVYENDVINGSVETALVYTKDGELYKCLGVEGRVFPDYDLGDKLYGATVSHNHPISVTEFSFSDDDIELFEKYNLQVLRGCDEKYTYELTRNALEIDSEPDDWMNFDNFRHANVINIAKEHGIGYRRWLNDKK